MSFTPRPPEARRQFALSATCEYGLAERHLARGDLPEAEAWYRVLGLAPLHPQATRGLASVLSAGGDRVAADQLCRELQPRLGREAGCRPSVEPHGN